MEIHDCAVHPQPGRSEFCKAAKEWTQHRQDTGHALISSCRENSIAQVSTSFTLLPNEVHLQFLNCNTRKVLKPLGRSLAEDTEQK